LVFLQGYFGKYLNEYDGSWVPVGWNRWEGLLHNSKFYNYTLRHNTYRERHKMSYKEDYFTDLITNRSISFIRRTKQAKPDSPFLAVVSHSAPHGPETAAPQYSNAFPNARAPRYVVTSNSILFGQHQELASQRSRNRSRNFRQFQGISALIKQSSRIN